MRYLHVMVMGIAAGFVVFFGELRKIQGHFREQYELFDLQSGEVSTGEMFSSAPTFILIGETMKHGVCLIDWQYHR